MEKLPRDHKLEPYSIKQLKRKLIGHFNNEIVFTVSQGMENVIFLKQKTEDILNDL